MHRRPLAISSVLSLLAGLVAVATASHGQALSGEYKIGVLDPLTGPLASEGKGHLEGFEICWSARSSRPSARSTATA
ncbi:MAG: hypothetical protein HYU51_05595 [Candidatus Rokubacteria bacterium]|nr:hypothetical protein [Candidatus Rokubacteria bacterium]